jgi:hypothetical protein
MLVTAGVAVQGRHQPTPQGAREQAKTAPPPAAAVVPDIAANQALAREQLALIDKAFDLPAQKDRRCAEHGGPGQMREPVNIRLVQIDGPSLRPANCTGCRADFEFRRLGYFFR